MKIFQGFVCLTLAVLVAAAGVADEKEDRKKGKGKRERKAPSVTARYVGKLDLNEEQKKKAAEIDAKFSEKAKALAAKRRGILTEDQLKAQRDAIKAAKESGKKGAEARKAVAAAVNLTDEQKKLQEELNAANKALQGEVLAALKPILTEEQVAKLPGGARKGKGAGDKPKRKKPEGKKPAGEKKKGEKKPEEKKDKSAA